MTPTYWLAWLLGMTIYVLAEMVVAVIRISYVLADQIDTLNQQVAVLAKNGR